MSALTFRSLEERRAIDELVACSGRPDITARWVHSLLDSGESLLEWCRGAWTDEGVLVAAHAFDSWSPVDASGPKPTFVHLLGHRDESAALELLATDIARFQPDTLAARLVIDVEASAPLRALRASQRDVLSAARFTVDVERVRLRWPDGVRLPRSSGRLTLRPAASFPNPTLVRIFAEVGDGSADYGMQRERAAMGREREAAERLTRAQRRDHPAEWFMIGLDGRDEPVGYVQSALGDPQHSMLAEVGVIESERGQRYVDDLLAYGTAVVINSVVPSLVSDTDVANRAMRAAFGRAGYVEFATRSDFSWHG